MKKVLVAVLCLFIFGACSRKNEEDQAGIPENSLELAIRSGGAVVPVEMPAAVYNFTGTVSNLVIEPQCFTKEEKISFKDLLPDEYTFLVLGNMPNMGMASLYLYGQGLKDISLRWYADSVPELFGGIVKVNGSRELETVEMKRLVGGLNVHVSNSSDFQEIRFSLNYWDLDTISLDGYTLNVSANYWNYLSFDKDIYLFPTREPLRGTVTACDENGQEYYFDFVTENVLQRNKRLELNLTLNKASSLVRSASVGNTVTCVEKISEL